MENGEKNRAIKLGLEDELAKDVARLYSWANVEGAPYRDFSMQRRLQHQQTLQVAAEKKREGPGNANDPENQAVAFDASTVDLPAIEASPPAHSEKAPTGNQIPSFQPEPSAPQEPLAPQVEVLSLPVAAVRARARPKSTELWSSPKSGEVRPVLAIYSLAGGVGRTTLCANLGRVLCSMGERILLVDASGSGLLPYYFGASDLRPGLRTFVAPGVNYSPLRVIGAEEVTGDWLRGDVRSAMLDSSRIIFDLGPASMSVLPEIFGMCTAILIPLLSDLNSILSIPRIEASLNRVQAKGIKIPSPFYVFNQFDAQNTMDQQARDLVVQQCGERLLPLTIHHGAEVAEAIASRMTVADHAPDSVITHDYMELATWLRRVDPARSTVRWSEQ